MTLDQLFGQDLTEEIKALARKRLLEGGNLGRHGCDRKKAKLALLLVREINPTEVFNREEAALLFGINRQTLRDKTRPFQHGVNTHD